MRSPQACGRAAGRPGRLRRTAAAAGAELARLPAAAAGLVRGPRDHPARPPSGPQNPCQSSQAWRPGPAPTSELPVFGAPPFPAGCETRECAPRPGGPVGSVAPGPCLLAVPRLSRVFAGNQLKLQLRSQPQGQKLMKRPPLQVNLSHLPPGAAPGMSSGRQW